MVFQLWVFNDHESRCFYKLFQNEVHTKYHDMRIGEQRSLNHEHYIIRVK